MIQDKHLESAPEKKPRKPRANKTNVNKLGLSAAFSIHHESIGDGKSNIWRGDMTDPPKLEVTLIEFGNLARICRNLEIPLVDKTPIRRT